MTETTLNYPEMMERALRGVLREVLAQVAEHGFPGEHHLYVTFRTDAAGVEIPARLRARYPEEMTVVLQRRFRGLEVDERAFGVTLSFDGKPERLLIPFDAVAGFVDPSVGFGFQRKERKEETNGAASEADGVGETRNAPLAGGTAGEVVALDSFRKK